MKAFVFLSILFIHWVGQFIAWSGAARSGSMRMLWDILAIPLVHVSGPLADHYFWAIATANSVLWAAILTYIAARFALRH